jgi:murein DD-endopeptidase MepM/ murein hydrolase activator NlpD
MKPTANRWKTISMDKKFRQLWIILLTSVLLSGCFRPDTGLPFFKVSGPVIQATIGANPNNLPENISQGDEQVQDVPLQTPTPNKPIVLPTLRPESLTYVVQPGDTLRRIAQEYQVSVAQLIDANEFPNPDLIEVGQVIIVPPPSFDKVASSFKIIPDSELVNSPSNAGFDIHLFVESTGGYLSDYSQEIDGTLLSGAEIMERVSVEYSVNPRLLLTLLEYQSQWLSQKNPKENTRNYPMRYYDPWREGLYNQLSWAANLLNEGYYLWKINAVNVWVLSDSSVVQVDPTINPGTAGVLNLMRYLSTAEEWDNATSLNGVYATYLQMFGYPFTDAVEPMIPENLVQPDLQLPFEDGDEWSFTGGPHGGWNTGSAWAAIDFAPPGDALGCFPSEAWVVASAPGEITYSDYGAVIQDLDGDGIWQTGWSILYMHIDPYERVEVGTYLEAGDRIGHPSCEGGFSSGTHLHLARRYNGEWIAADAEIPLVLDGWVSAGYGVEYDGYLIKGDQTLEAWNGRSPLNAIKR